MESPLILDKNDKKTKSNSPSPLMKEKKKKIEPKNFKDFLEFATDNCLFFLCLFIFLE